MTDIRRTLLWVVFSMSLVLIWDAWNRHNGQPSFFGPQPQKTVAASAPGGASSATPGAAGVPQASTTLPAPGAAAAAGAQGQTPQPPAASQQVELTTDLVKATFDSQGGTLTRLELLSYRDPVNPADNVVLLDRSAKRVYLAQTGLVSPQTALPNHLSMMRVVAGDTSLRDGLDELKLSFESPAQSGVTLRKTYTLKRGSYVMDVKHEIVNAGGQAVTPQLYLQLMRDGNPPEGESSFYFTFTGPAAYTEAKRFHKIAFKDIEKGSVDIERNADNGWIAMVQHYFASAWLMQQGVQREYRTAKVSDNLYSIAMVQTLPAIEPGATTTVDSRLFVGPQEERKLEALAPGLELVKDYGWVTILAKPLFWLLEHLHQMLGNWGWAIVALVVLLKAAFYWLNASAYRSMAKMKAVNPRITELRERLKDKPQQLQQEMMRIYREEKVNPIGGCLPIFVQMPFFIALYWVLLSSVEMRNAPWIGWITDLSAKDPYFILPLLMTASSLFQTWLNPTPPDPVQARMMWLMPLVFSVMFFFFPAGLVLYWLTNNVLSIAQQWFINKRMGVLKT